MGILLGILLLVMTVIYGEKISVVGDVTLNVG
jgi:hypothetical protein